MSEQKLMLEEGERLKVEHAAPIERLAVKNTATTNNVEYDVAITDKTENQGSAGG